ncbi:MAG: DUF177 domain-containing protein [Dermatophilaceae bacterium]
MTRTDHRSPWMLDISDLGRRPGSMIEVEREIPVPADFGTEVLAVPEDRFLALFTRLESVVEGVLVTGTVRSTAVGACVRCLDPVSTDVEARFQELFAYADRAAHHREVGAGDDETELVIVDGLINLEPLLRDAVVPALPFKPVCREDCLGLCAQCGARMEDDPGHEHIEIDPRWKALTELASDPDSTDNA